jgi:protein transport protein SEC23
MPVGECGFALESILEDLQRDPWPKAADQRPARCTGVALSVAVSLLERATGRSGGRVLVFAGGPCTVGPGKVVDRDLKEVMRSHTDLQKENAPHFKKACEFYRVVADRLVGSGHAVDFFGCSGDQLGLLELRPCITKSGGLCVLADAFKQSVFKESFRRVFKKWADTAPAPDAGHLQMGFGASLEVVCSREYKVSGAIGPCSSLRRVNASVSETEIGEGGTFAWSLGAVDPTTTVALYFDMASQGSAASGGGLGLGGMGLGGGGGGGGGMQGGPGKRHHLQVITNYQHSSGRLRMRVTTTAGTWNADPNDLSSMARLFDQEAAAVMMARIATHRTETEDPPDIIRWLDRSLIRLCSRFAEYRKDDPSSFRLSPNFSLFPQFMFHLRRSKFMQTFNTSPDEAAYYRLTLMREDVTNSLTMIQPALMQYTFQQPPQLVGRQPVLLDATSVKPDVILLLDDFFMVLLFHGETIAQWREQGFQDRPEHEAFRAVLAAPKEDAAQVMESRFPVPRYVVCDQHKSQARFLLSKVNPSVTHNNMDGSGTAPVFTDDVSYHVFMESLLLLAVQSN